METRALCIAFFYAIGTAAGGITGPLLFGKLIDNASADQGHHRHRDRLLHRRGPDDRRRHRRGRPSASRPRASRWRTSPRRSPPRTHRAGRRPRNRPDRRDQQRRQQQPAPAARTISCGIRCGSSRWMSPCQRSIAAGNGEPPKKSVARLVGVGQAGAEHAGEHVDPPRGGPRASARPSPPARPGRRARRPSGTSSPAPPSAAASPPRSARRPPPRRRSPGPGPTAPMTAPCADVVGDQHPRRLGRPLRAGSEDAPRARRLAGVSDQLVVGFDLDMTLIDTVVGFAATLDVLGAELGVEFPTAEMTAKLGPPLELLLEPYLPAEQIEAAGRPVPRDLPGSRRRADARLRRASPRRWPPYDATTGASCWSPASTRPTPSCTSTTSGSTSTSSRGASGAPARARCCAGTGPSIYVGDHVHDVEGARAAGVTSVSVLTGGCTREELEAAGHRRRPADDLTAFPAWLDDHVLERRLAALEAAPARAGPGAGGVQRGSRQRVPARGRRPGARPGARRRGHGVLRLAAAGRARPRPRLRDEPRRARC